VDPLTNKVFNIHFFIQYGTFYSHLIYQKISLSSVSQSILYRYTSPQTEAFLSISKCTCITIATLNWTRHLDTLSGILSALRAERTLVEPRLWYHCWVMRGFRGSSHFVLKNYTCELDITLLTQKPEGIRFMDRLGLTYI